MQRISIASLPNGVRRSDQPSTESSGRGEGVESSPRLLSPSFLLDLIFGDYFFGSTVRGGEGPYARGHAVMTGKFIRAAPLFRLP